MKAMRAYICVRSWTHLFHTISIRIGILVADLVVIIMSAACEYPPSPPSTIHHLPNHRTQV
jgi:hypothetical protein